MTQLEKFRLKKGFSYLALQKYLEENGLKVSDVTCHCWCKRQKVPRPKHAELLAKILNISFADIYNDYSEACNMEDASEIIPSEAITRTGS